MDKEELRCRELFRNYSTAKLRKIQANYKDGTQEQATVEQMLHERDFWKKFWTSGIVAWISLGVSITALILVWTRHVK
jgi:hypothetical protein